MNKLRLLLANNRGYALLVTLAAITIFSVLGFTFITHAVNTTKQTYIIEEKVQAADMAELGIEYYDQMIDEELEKIKNDIPNMIKIIEENYEKEELSNGEILKKIYGEIDDKIGLIEKDLKENKKKKIMDFSENEKFFELDDWSHEYDELEKKIEYKVKGKVGDSEAFINAYIELGDIYFVDSNPGENNNWIDLQIPDFIEFENCNKNDDMYVGKKCEFDEWTIPNSKKNTIITRSVFKINNNLEFPNFHNVNFKRSVFWVQGNFNNSQNLKGNQEYTAYVGGNAILGHLDNSKTVNLFINKNATLGHLSNSESVNLFVNGNAQIKHADNMKNSLIYVNGTLNLGKTDNSHSTKICANYVESYDGGDADFYALKVSKNVKNKAKKDIKVGEELFNQNCKINPDPFENNDGTSDDLSWDIVSKKEYKYE